MRNVSNIFKQTMEERRNFYESAEITFANGDVKTVEKEGFCVSGNSIIDSAESSSFPLGVLAAKRINLCLMNDEDQWSEYDFYWAKIRLQTKFDLDDGTTETLNIGTFAVITPESYGTTIAITAMDDSYKTDKPYDTARDFPLSLGEALRDSCATCNITLSNASFPNSDYVIPQKPKDITHRQFIGMCAMIAGGNARFDEWNRLVIIPYNFSAFESVNAWDGGSFQPWTDGEEKDGGTFAPWTEGDVADGGTFGDRDNIHVLYQITSGMKIEADDVVITGVQMTSTDESNNTVTHLFGSEGYVLSVENRLAEGKEDEVVRLIGQSVVGLRFRPFSADHIALPTAEFMDLAMIVDWKQNVYATVLTDVNFTYFGFTNLKCSADSPIRNSSKYYGNDTKAIVQARQMVEHEKTEREKAVEILANELANSNGLYMTEERQDDGSTIYYMHDKLTLGESKVVWKLTANAFGISTDGGKSYPYGLDATGTAILNRIYAIGINADYLKTGCLTVQKGGKTMFSADLDTGKVVIVADSFSLSSGATIDSIAKSAASSAANNALSSAESYADNKLSGANSYADKAAKNAVDAQTQTSIFNKLTNGGQEQGIFLQNGKIYINAEYLSVDYLSAISANLGAIRAGRLMSQNYVWTGQTGNFSAQGMEITMDYGTIYSPHFTVDYAGNAHFSGNLEGASGTFSGTLSAGVVAGSTIRGSTFETDRASVYNAKMTITGGEMTLTAAYESAVQSTAGKIMGESRLMMNDQSESSLLVPAVVLAAQNMFAIDIGGAKNAIGVSVGDGNGIGFRIRIPAFFNNYVAIYGTLEATGQKLRVVDTADYGRRGLYCYEMSSPMFGDIGEGVTDENGECFIDISDIFSETVTTKMEYQVFLQKEGEGDVWVKEKNPQYFIVSGTANLKFAWEVKVKQRDYEYDRMEIRDAPNDDEINYEQQYIDEINNLIINREAIT